MLLSGGVSQNSYGGGLDGGSLFGAIGEKVKGMKDGITNTLESGARHADNNALAASLSNVTFNPTMAQITPLQYMQAPQQNNLYNRMMGY